MAKNRFYERLDTRRAMLMAAPFCAIFAAQQAHAVDYNPTNLADLRADLIATNAAGTNDRIFLPAGTITLDAGRLSAATGDLDITKNSGTLEIIGAGQTTTIIDADGQDRGFNITGTSAVTISNLTIRNGLATDNGIASPSSANGGAIVYYGSGGLTLVSVTITQCEAAGLDGSAGTTTFTGDGGNGQIASGGGIYISNTSLTLTDCTISNNTVRGGAGGAGAAAGPSFGSGLVFGTTGANGGDGGAAFGGGIAAATVGGTLTISGTTISGNLSVGGEGGAGGRGGDAIASGTGAFVTAVGGDGGAGGQSGYGRGGGIYVFNGTLNLSDSCVSGNSANVGACGTGGRGGDGIASGNATLSSTGVGGPGGNGGGLAGGGYGGGVYFSAGTGTIVNSTLSGNSAAGGNGGNGGTGGDGSGGTFTVPGSGGDGGNGWVGQGGGVYASTGTLDILNSTVAFNTVAGGNGGLGGPPGFGGTSSSSGADGNFATGSGGGIFVDLATVTLDSTIVSDGSADTGSNIAGSVTADACVIETTAGASITAGPNGNLNGDPGLSALALNGGPTRNHRIAETSIARNAGTNPLTLTTDQRGQARDDGGGVDIGAFEFTPGVDDTGGGGNGNGDGGGSDSSCSTGTQPGWAWLLAPLAALIALFRRRKRVVD